MRIRVLLFVLVLLCQSGVSEADTSQIFVRIFDEALSESTVAGCLPLKERAGQAFPNRFREPVHEALELEVTKFFLSGGISCAPPDSENIRKIQYWTLDAMIVSEEDAVPIIKQKLVELGADNGSRISFGPSSAKSIDTLVNGEWLPTKKLDYEFAAEALVPTTDITKIFDALSSSNLALENEGLIIQRAETVPDDHAYIFDSKLKRQSRYHPIRIAMQKTEGTTIVFTLQSRDKHLANLVQTALDSSL